MVVAPKPREIETIAGTGNAGKVRKRRNEGRTRKEIEDDLQMMVPQVNRKKTACDVKCVYHVLCFKFNITILKGITLSVAYIHIEFLMCWLC